MKPILTIVKFGCKISPTLTAFYASLFFSIFFFTILVLRGDVDWVSKVISVLSWLLSGYLYVTLKAMYQTPLKVIVEGFNNV